MTIGQAEVVHQLFPAVPVPFRRSRRIDPAALDRYAAWMAEQPVGGVAVWRTLAAVFS